MSAEFFGEYSNEDRNSKFSSNGQTNNIKDELQGTSIGVSAYYSLGYYPNNRTFLNTGVSLEATLSDFKRGTLQEGSHILPAAFIDMNYFLSYRTMLKATVSLQYDQDHTKTVISWNKQEETKGYYYITLSHFLF